MKTVGMRSSVAMHSQLLMLYLERKLLSHDSFEYIAPKVVDDRMMRLV